MAKTLNAQLRNSFWVTDLIPNCYVKFLLRVFGGLLIKHALIKNMLPSSLGFPDGTEVKDLPANGEDIRYMGSIPGLGRSPGGGNGNPLQYLCLRNPMDRGTRQATVHRIAKSKTWLSDLACMHSPSSIKHAHMHRHSFLGAPSQCVMSTNTMPVVFSPLLLILSVLLSSANLTP